LDILFFHTLAFVLAFETLFFAQLFLHIQVLPYCPEEKDRNKTGHRNRKAITFSSYGAKGGSARYE